MDFIGFKNKYEYKKVVENNNSAPLKPEVSVCVQTYQHANYIKECLDGILCQETNFDFEVLLGEDHSSDGTREICIDYAKSYPDKIRLFLHHRENNIKIGGQPTGRFNFLYNLYSAHGKYTALCEGDDYWTDPLKLQKQVDFLEENEDYNIHSGQINTYFQNENKFKQNKLQNSYSITVGDLLSKSHIKTCTLLFKNIKLTYPDLFFKEKGADRQLQILLLKDGQKGYVSNEVYAVYRKHDQGLTSTFNKSLYNERYKSSLAQVRISKDWNKFLKMGNSSTVRKNKVNQFKRMINFFVRSYDIRYIFGGFKIFFY